ncbi:MAG: hypothetical protein Q9168_002056 [Polycauliona sp. 1 TL-2023]
MTNTLAKPPKETLSRISPDEAIEHVLNSLKTDFQVICGRLNFQPTDLMELPDDAIKPQGSIVYVDLVDRQRCYTGSFVNQKGGNVKMGYYQTWAKSNIRFESEKTPTCGSYAALASATNVATLSRPNDNMISSPGYKEVPQLAADINTIFSGPTDASASSPGREEDLQLTPNMRESVSNDTNSVITDPIEFAHFS